MSNIRFMPIDTRLEAGAFLTRLAYRGDDPKSGGMRASAERYSRKYGVPIDEFAGLIEAYESIEARFVCDEKELLILFGVCNGLENSVYDEFTMMERALGKERAKSLDLRVAILTAGDDGEPNYDNAGFSDLLACAQQLPVSDEARWLFTDACVRYGEYRARIDALLDQAEALVRENLGLLQPYADAALRDFSGDPTGEALFSHLAEAGLRLDCAIADVFPFIFQFSSIALFSNFVTAAHFGDPEQTFIAYGCMIDRINACSETGRDAAESMLGLLHALDDKRRLEILTALKNRPLCGQDLAALTGLSAATISHHMNELASTGLVGIEKQGVKLFYHLKAERFGDLCELLQKGFLE